MKERKTTVVDTHKRKMARPLLMNYCNLREYRGFHIMSEKLVRPERAGELCHLNLNHSAVSMQMYKRICILVEDFSIFTISIQLFFFTSFKCSSKKMAFLLVFFLDIFCHFCLVICHYFVDR